MTYHIKPSLLHYITAAVFAAVALILLVGTVIELWTIVRSRTARRGAAVSVLSPPDHIEDLEVRADCSL